MKPLIIGNWKMNGSVDLLLRTLKAFHPDVANSADIVVCPPFPYLSGVAVTHRAIQLGAQSCAAAASGAYTGEVAACMLQELGVSYCIVGHSERRKSFGEDDSDVAQKVAQLLGQGIKPVVCVGETLEEREQGIWRNVVEKQLLALACHQDHDLIVAYEPVWAIGTGTTPTGAQIECTLNHIRQTLVGFGFGRRNLRILYGGSANEENAAKLMALEATDGLLVGGASLEPAKFKSIVDRVVDTNWSFMRC